jgi:MFS family permease
MGTSRRVAWLLFAAAWGTNHFVPLLLVYRAHLRLSSIELAILFGVYALGLVPGLLLGGPLSDRKGRRAVVLPASFVALVGTGILSAGAAGFAVLLAGRFVVGLGAGATFSAGTAWVQDLAAGETEGTGARRAAVALSSGFGGGPLVTGILAQWLPSPMKLPYVVHAVVLVQSIVAVVVARPEPAKRSAWSTFNHPPRDERRLPLGFAHIAVVAPWVFTFPSVSHAVLPALVRAKVGPLSVVFAGVVTATTLLSGVLVQPMLQRWPLRSASTFGLSTGAAGLLCGALAAAAVWPPGVLLAAVLLGSGYGGCLIAGLRFVEATTTAASRGRVTGVYYALTYLGFAAPLLLAALAKWTGEVASLLVAFALASATLLWSRRFMPGAKRNPVPPP